MESFTTLFIEGTLFCSYITFNIFKKLLLDAGAMFYSQICLQDKALYRGKIVIHRLRQYKMAYANFTV
jgi:hypothetical protein